MILVNVPVYCYTRLQKATATDSCNGATECAETLVWKGTTRTLGSTVAAMFTGTIIVDSFAECVRFGYGHLIDVPCGNYYREVCMCAGKK